MLLTQLEYFVAVAREQHFARAAAACFVSPSALSEAIHKLEAELDVPLIRRGRSFEGLTPEGETTLVWAQRILSEHRSLHAALQSAHADLSANVRIGAIPSAVGQAARLVARIGDSHPHARVQLVTGLTSEQIADRLRHFELDAGLLHPSGEMGADLEVHPLYADPFVLLVPAGDADVLGDSVSGEAVMRMRLCLFEPGMRARQLVDDAFARRGLVLTPQVETDSVEALIMLVSGGAGAAVVPRSAVLDGTSAAGLRLVELVDPEVTLEVALAHLSERPRSPIVDAVTAAITAR